MPSWKMAVADASKKLTNPTWNEYRGRIIVFVVLTFQKKLLSQTEDAICVENLLNRRGRLKRAARNL